MTDSMMLSRITLVVFVSGIVFFAVMVILAYAWRIPGIPLSRRFGEPDISKFIRPERLAFFARARTLFAVAFFAWVVIVLIYLLRAAVLS